MLFQIWNLSLWQKRSNSKSVFVPCPGKRFTHTKVIFVILFLNDLSCSCSKIFPNNNRPIVKYARMRKLGLIFYSQNWQIYLMLLNPVFSSPSQCSQLHLSYLCQVAESPIIWLPWLWMRCPFGLKMKLTGMLCVCRAKEQKLMLITSSWMIFWSRYQIKNHNPCVLNCFWIQRKVVGRGRQGL